MRATDFWARLSATIFVLGGATLFAVYAAGAPEGKVAATAIIVGAILAISIVITLVCAIWES